MLPLLYQDPSQASSLHPLPPPSPPPGNIPISEALSYCADPHPLTYIKPLTDIVLFIVGRYTVCFSIKRLLWLENRGWGEPRCSLTDGGLGCWFFKINVVMRSNETHGEATVMVKCSEYYQKQKVLFTIQDRNLFTFFFRFSFGSFVRASAG